MLGRTYGRNSLPLVCLLLLASCSKHKLAPIGAVTPVLPAANNPPAATPAPPESKVPPTAKRVAEAKHPAPDVNRLLPGPPRMSFSPDGRVATKSAPRVDKITVLVDAGSDTVRPDSKVVIQNALHGLGAQFLFLCPDHMRAGVTEDCRFTIKEGTTEFFRALLIEQGVDSSQAAAVSLLMHAELTSPDKSAFDIRAAANNSSEGGQTWHVVPRNPGGHKLALSVTPSARIVSAGDVQGEPFITEHPISVVGAEPFVDEYGPALLGCLAALGLLAWIGWTLRRHSRPSVFSSR